MSQFARLVCICAIAFVSSRGVCQETGPVFQAGAAVSNITPPLGELIVGGWQPFPAKHIHDELFARCLVLDDGTTKLAFVICDNVGIPREVFELARRYLHDETGLPVDNVLMASTAYGGSSQLTDLVHERGDRLVKTTFDIQGDADLSESIDG